MRLAFNLITFTTFVDYVKHKEAEIADEVERLGDDKVLNKGQGNSLISAKSQNT